MDIANCPRCGKIFTKMSEPICANCLKEEEEQFKLVKKYVDEHPDCIIADVVEATGVSEKKVLKYVREGRFEATAHLSSTTCEKCGRPIRMGKYCEKCILEINDDVSKAFTEKKYEGPRMHTSPISKKN